MCDADKEAITEGRLNRKRAFVTLLFTAVIALPLELIAQDTLEEIVVVGSAIGIDEKQIESQAMPIQLIGPEQIALSGQFTVDDILRSQPAFLGVSDSNTDGAKANLNLRGLGSAYTLTLIDGKRFSANGPGNIAAIPAAAIERIEILKAGASSIYGADAVAGVVNLVLKDSQDGFGFNARVGGADGWDFQDYTISLGGESENSKYFLLANWYENGTLDAHERPIVTNDKTPFGGRNFNSNFQNPGRVIFSDGTNLILNTDQFGFGESSLNPADYRPFDFVNDLHDRAFPCEGCQGEMGYAPADRLSLIARGSHDLTDRTTLSTEFMYNKTNELFIGGTSTFLVNVPATNPHNPFGEAVDVAFRPFPDSIERINGFSLNSTGGVNFEELDTVRGSVTLDQRLTDDLSLSVMANIFDEKYEQSRPNVYVTEAFNASMNNPDPSQSINVFCNRCNSAEVYEGVRATRREIDNAEMHEFDARIVGDLFSIPTGSVQTAFGAYYRKESFSSEKDPLFASGALEDSAPGDPQFLGRDVTAVFGEVRVPLSADRSDSGLPRFELGASLRYEDYSDFGSTTDPMISLKGYVVPDNLMVRATWNTSFRAPELEDITASQSFSEIFPFDPVAGMQVDAQAIVGGNPNLKSEDAETLSIGLVYLPESIPELLLSVDYWNVEQTNVILAPSAQAILDGDVPGNVIRCDACGGGGENLIIEAFLVNLAGRKMSGIDLNFRYSRDVWNDVNVAVDLAATHALTFEADSLNGQGFQDIVGTADGLFGGLPELRAVGGLTVNRGDWSSRLGLTYITDYTDPAFGPFLTDTSVDDVFVADLSLKYEPANGDESLFGFNPSVTVGINNLTDTEPPFVRRYNFIERWMHDIRGRIWYVSVGGNF